MPAGCPSPHRRDQEYKPGYRAARSLLQNGATTTATRSGTRFGGAALAEARRGGSLVGRIGHPPAGGGTSRAGRTGCAPELAVDVSGFTVGEEDIAAELGVWVHGEREDALEAALRRPAARAREGQRADGEVGDMAVRLDRAEEADGNRAQPRGATRRSARACEAAGTDPCRTRLRRSPPSGLSRPERSHQRMEPGSVSLSPTPWSG